MLECIQRILLDFFKNFMIEYVHLYQLFIKYISILSLFQNNILINQQIVS